MPAVQTRFDLPPVQPPDVDFVEIWSADTPTAAIEHLTRIEQRTSHVTEFIETANEAAQAHTQVQDSPVTAASHLESAITRHVTRLRAAIGDNSFADTRQHVVAFCSTCSSAITLSAKYPDYPFEHILQILGEAEKDDPVPEATLDDISTILQTTEDALDFIDSVDYEHPAVDQDAWEESITLALEEAYPEALRPVSTQLSRLDDGVWEREDLSAYEWQPFERLVGDLYRDEGHEVTVTQSTSDLGVDIWVSDRDRRLAIQVKHYQAGQTVGRETLQKLVSTLAKGDADEAVVVTSGDFADTAKRYAADFGDDLSLVGSRELVTRLSESSIPPEPA